MLHLLLLPPGPLLPPEHEPAVGVLVLPTSLLLLGQPAVLLVVSPPRELRILRGQGRHAQGRQGGVLLPAPGLPEVGRRAITPEKKSMSGNKSISERSMSSYL